MRRGAVVVVCCDLAVVVVELNRGWQVIRVVFVKDVVEAVKQSSSSRLWQGKKKWESNASNERHTHTHGEEVRATHDLLQGLRSLLLPHRRLKVHRLHIVEPRASLEALEKGQPRGREPDLMWMRRHRLQQLQALNALSVGLEQVQHQTDLGLSRYLDSPGPYRDGRLEVGGVR